MTKEYRFPLSYLSVIACISVTSPSLRPLQLPDLLGRSPLAGCTAPWLQGTWGLGPNQTMSQTKQLWLRKTRSPHLTKGAVSLSPPTTTTKKKHHKQTHTHTHTLKLQMESANLSSATDESRVQLMSLEYNWIGWQVTWLHSSYFNRETEKHQRFRGGTKRTFLTAGTWILRSHAQLRAPIVDQNIHRGEGNAKQP